MEEAGKMMDKMKTNAPDQYNQLVELNKNVTFEWKETKFIGADSLQAVVYLIGSKDDKENTLGIQMRKVDGKWYVKP